MGKLKLYNIKKAMGLLFAVFFLMSATAVAVSAQENRFVSVNVPVVTQNQVTTTVVPLTQVGNQVSVFSSGNQMMILHGYVNVNTFQGQTTSIW